MDRRHPCRGAVRTYNLLVFDITSLPGEELVRTGLEDLANGHESVEALLLLVGAPRLREIGLDVPDRGIEFPEHRLYDLLAREDSDSAHSRYNALIRRMCARSELGSRRRAAPRHGIPSTPAATRRSSSLPSSVW